MPRRPKEWGTFAGRLEWMFAHFAKLGVSAREIGRRAQIDERQISVMRRRVREGGDIEFARVAALRHAFEISWEWFADGKGWPTAEIQDQFEGPESSERPAAKPSRGN